MSLAEVEKSGKGSKISDRLAAIEAEGKKWERKYEKPAPQRTASKNGLADRLASIESNSKNWKSKYEKNDRTNEESRDLSQRLSLLNKSQETWKSKNEKVTDHQKLNVAFRAERYTSPNRPRSMIEKSQSFKMPLPEERRGRVKEKVIPVKFQIPDIPKIIVSPDDEVDMPAVSMIEKIATKRGEDNIKVKISKERILPTMDLDGLEELFSSAGGCRHSIALGELDGMSQDFKLPPQDQLPRQGQFLNTRMRKPKRAHSGRPARKNPLKTGQQGETTYTEVRTNVSEVMSGKYFANSALAGLAAKEDITNVRLRSASRNRDDSSQLPFRHPLLIRFKGRRRVFPCMVPCSYKSLCHDDAFILVTVDEVFVFLPELANVVEKAKAKDFGSYICQTSDLGTAAKRPKTVFERGSEMFWTIVGGRLDDEIELDHDPDEADEEYEHSQADQNRCWKLSPGADGLVPEMRGWAKLPTQELLVSDGVYVFEFSNEVYLWLGSQVPFPLRRTAQQLAKQLWKKYPRTDDAFFGRITQHRETALFTEKFDDWMRPNQENLLTPIHHRQKNNNTSNSHPSYKLISIDMTKDNVQTAMMSGKYNISDGNGEVVDRDGRIMQISTVEYQIKLVKNGNLVDQSKNSLFDDSVVVVVWKYCISGTGKWHGKEMKKVKQFSQPKGATRELVLLWGGQSSNELELGEAALLATDLKLGTIFNVQPGFEPDAFTKAWNGALRFNISSSTGPALYIIMGHSTDGAYLQQIQPFTRGMRDTHAFILIDDHSKQFATFSTLRTQKIYLEVVKELTQKLCDDGYQGGPCTERKHRKWFNSNVTGSAVEDTGAESIDKIWKIEKLIDQLIPIQLPSRRLSLTGPFDQSQLNNVCIIKTNSRVLVWYENKDTEGSNQSDYQNVIQGAKTLAERMFEELSWEGSVDVVAAGSEPIQFERLFPIWKRPVITV